MNVNLIQAALELCECSRIVCLLGKKIFRSSPGVFHRFFLPSRRADLRGQPFRERSDPPAEGETLPPSSQVVFQVPPEISQFVCGGRGRGGEEFDFANASTPAWCTYSISEGSILRFHHLSTFCFPSSEGLSNSVHFRSVEINLQRNHFHFDGFLGFIKCLLISAILMSKSDLWSFLWDGKLGLTRILLDWRILQEFPGSSASSRARPPGTHVPDPSRNFPAASIRTWQPFRVFSRFRVLPFVLILLGGWTYTYDNRSVSDTVSETVNHL